jgi:membrane-associated phospholipid phosphatase
MMTLPSISMGPRYINFLASARGDAVLGPMRAEIGASVGVLWLVLAASSAAAQEPYALRMDPVLVAAVDVPLVAGLVTVHLVHDSPAACVWCNQPGIDVAISEALGSERGRTSLAMVSDLGLYGAWFGGLSLAFAGGYLGLGGGERSLSRGAEDLFIVAEAALATQLVTLLVKRVVARERPDRAAGLTLDSRSHESFFSGHASQTAALAASASALSYLRGYPFRAGVLVSGLAITATVGLLRVVACKHWPSDVLVGWIVGGALGVALPLLLHPRLDPEEGPAQQAGAQTLTLPVARF